MVRLDPQWIAWAQESQAKFSVPAAVTLAQFCLESSWGAHMPQGSNNPFGIKAVASQPYVLASTHEYVNGKTTTILARFRKFDSLEQAFLAHALLLSTAAVYKPAMQAWLAGNLELGVQLMAQHYATSPTYAASVMQIIKQYDLAQYDRVPAAPAATPAPAAPIPSPSRPPNTAASPKPGINIWLELLQGLLSLFSVKSRG